jgi:hypothetical protein
MLKFLIFMLTAVPCLDATIFYDEDGRPDYEKINESREEKDG